MILLDSARNYIDKDLFSSAGAGFLFSFGYTFVSNIRDFFEPHPPYHDDEGYQSPLPQEIVDEIEPFVPKGRGKIDGCEDAEDVAYKNEGSRDNDPYDALLCANFSYCENQSADSHEGFPADAVFYYFNCPRDRAKIYYQEDIYNFVRDTKQG